MILPVFGSNLAVMSVISSPWMPCIVFFASSIATVQLVSNRYCGLALSSEKAQEIGHEWRSFNTEESNNSRIKLIKSKEAVQTTHNESSDG